MVYADKFKLHERQKNYKSGTLRSIVFDVTPRCNMNCSHCSASTFSKTKPIELSKLKKPLTELYGMGVYHYVLAGGEPITDFSRLESIISMIYPDETYVNVLSNGWKMNKDVILKLKDMKVDKICYSLDSGIPFEHDLNRRKGSYERVLKAIDSTLEAGLFASVATVATPEYLYSDGFKTLFDYAKKKQIRLQIDIAMPVGKWDANEDILLKKEDSDYLKNLWENSPIISDGKKLITRDIFGEFEQRCRAGNEGMAISSDGQFLPCNFLQFSLGNIAEKSVKEMYSALSKSEWFNKKNSLCLAGEDRIFFNKFIKPYKNLPKPLDAWKIFRLKI